MEKDENKYLLVIAKQTMTIIDLQDYITELGKKIYKLEEEINKLKKKVPPEVQEL